MCAHRPRRPSTALEEITLTTHGADARGAERGIDLATQVPDVHLDHVGVSPVSDTPHVVQDLLLGPWSALVAHQVLEKGELASRELDGGLPAAHGASARIEHEIVDHDLDRVAGGGPPQQGATASD